MLPKLVNRHLETHSLGREILHFPQCDSTNRIAKELSNNYGTLVIAGSQTSGRGRSGKEWQSSKGGVYMSIVLPPKDTAVITLICALAVHRAFGKGEIKWPNDIVIGSKKVCGILCERTDNAVVCGIGVNIYNKVPKDIPATSISSVNPSKLVAKILNELENLLEYDFSTLRNEYERCCVNINRPVEAVFNNRSVKGIAKGVTDTGELIIDTPEGIITVNSGEVSVRGIYGYV